jgi:hypothetical protein
MASKKARIAKQKVLQIYPSAQLRRKGSYCCIGGLFDFGPEMRGYFASNSDKAWIVAQEEINERFVNTLAQ